MSAVNSEQRRLLERVVGDARDAAESAARAALKRLAVDQNDPFATMSPADRTLRNLLRAESRRLGSFEALVTEVAYQHWHRMLFARFLAENSLLMVEGMDVAVTLEECADIAAETGQPDAWAVACRYAAAMLPGVFRTGDPVLQVRFATEGRLALEQLLNSLPAPIFKADDSLGWVYQFWQAKAKAEVNASGRKVGGADISPVTQLFTEHYMVQFLLHNSLGAWWAARHPDEELPTEVSYLRRLDDGSPAAGTFSGWPATAKEIKILDPSCGSGHFLVAAFSLMVRFRMAEEGLSESDAGNAVLRDNLFGLELDPRCTQIAAFALALTAWKHGGYRELPLPNVACSGIRLGGTADDWRKLAGRDGIMQAVLAQVRELFAQAPDLGSLLDPNTIGQTITPRPRAAALPSGASGLVLQMGLLPTATPTLWESAEGSGGADDDNWAGAGQLSPLVAMERLLPKLAEAAERFGEGGDDTPIFGEAAKQAVRAVGLLAGKYHLVITNVPYLGRGNQGETLRNFCATQFPRAKADLATVFIERCLQFCASGGSTALVTPQNWLFLGSYASLRGYLLRQKTWDVVARLGPGAFETISGEVVNVGLFVLTNAPSPPRPPSPAPRGEGGVGGREGAATLSSLLPTPPLPAERERGPGGEGASLPGGEGISDDLFLSKPSEEIIRRARELRGRATQAETLLWEFVRDRRNAGIKFRRQHPLGHFIADFYCETAKLVIELDGAVHAEAEQAERDRNRDAVIRANHYRILRFTNEQAMTQTADVLHAIHQATLPSLPLPLPSPPSPSGVGEGGRGGEGSSGSRGSQGHTFAGLDVSAPRTAREKDGLLRTAPVQMVKQTGQLNNPESCIMLMEVKKGQELGKFATIHEGLHTGDYPRFGRNFWEMPGVSDGWDLQQVSAGADTLYGGREYIIRWDSGQGELISFVKERLKSETVSMWIKGKSAWGKFGVAVSKMRDLRATLYNGSIFTHGAYVIIPFDKAHLLPIWMYCDSPEFVKAARTLDQNLAIARSVFDSVPFDLAHWQKVADEKYPDGLPEPHSDDPTQWLFDGHPAHAKGAPGDALQVAVARLLGYRWPRQTGAEIPGCHLLPDDGLDAHADSDGIVCLPSVAGESSAAERLRGLLAAAFEDKSKLAAAEIHSTIERLLAEAGYGGNTLDEWLRDGFFAQHIKRFHNRPFLWHIWDGVKKDGFSAIVNYHKLDRAKLEKLTYTYLGDWINRQAEGDRNDVPGANARLVAARKLQKKLETILEGEPPYDIYVRWKSLAEQPLGWEPDLNDGVRLNIRPFVQAEVLRVKKPSINWNKDRGTNPDSTERHNDLHRTLAEKRKTREIPME